MTAHDHGDFQVRAAAAPRPPDDHPDRARRAARVLALMQAMAEATNAGIDVLAAELDELGAQTAGDPELTVLVESAHVLLMVRRAAENGSESALRRLPAAVASLGASVPDNPAVTRMREFLQSGVDMMVANHHGDLASVWQRFDRMQTIMRDLPTDDPFRDSLMRASAPALALRALFDNDGSPAPDRSGDQDLAALAEQSLVGQAVGGLIEGAAMLGMGAETDLVRIDHGIAEFRKALAATARHDPQRAICLQALALALFRRSEVTGRTGGLDEAAALLAEAATLLGGPQHPQWTFVHDLVSAIRQRTGEYGGVPDSTRAAQRGHVWRVLLEADPASARLSVKDAAHNALDHARRCISVGDPGGALWSLDAGRGLMLFAAKELHRIPARLVAAGRRDLAEQWLRHGAPSDGQRRQVLDALTKDATDNLFDPPTVAEVQSALAMLEADALVYLVPADPPLGGLAVMAPRVGPPAFMALPHLHLAAGTDVDRYLSALNARAPVDNRRDLSAGDNGGFAERVDALCDWAWRAAIGPLLDSYLPRLPARSDGRPPRLIVIPMGELARVPWHAARRRDGVHAVQLAAISQAVSARLLCENAALPAVPLGSTGLVVGDPDVGDRADPLHSARVEAYEVRQAFYRGARYVGRLRDGRPSPSGSGTAPEVRNWLTSRSPAAGSMLHLACHGFYASGPSSGARLLLAGSEIGVEELVDLLASAPDRAISLVVLAACNSGRSVYGYDEAYSLGTGFLAGGVRSVLSTQWSIPDAATSSLMFLFHHYARCEGMPAWQALRQAQMWMLDPDRRPPRGMPPELVPGDGDDPTNVLGWAGFVHYGQ